MNKSQIVLMCLGMIGGILVILGYLIKFKNQIRLIAGVAKNDDKIKDKKAFASLVGGNLLILGLIFCVGDLWLYLCPGCKNLIEVILLLSLLSTGVLTYTKSKKYLS